MARMSSTFALAEKGGSETGLPHKGKGTRLMPVVDQDGTPIGALAGSAQGEEIMLADLTLATGRAPQGRSSPHSCPEELVADGGYDSQLCRRRMRRRGISTCIPERRGNMPQPDR